MLRITLLTVLLTSVLAACGALSELPASPVPQMLLPTATEAALPSSVGGSLASIPLGVGQGVEGGWYQLYFTDPSNPVAAQISGGPDDPLVAAMDAAGSSIDTAIYSLSLNSVRRALIRAHRRGVEVRVVMESDNLDRSDPQALKDAGIPVFGDRGEGLMHNKFVVIDRAEVWTGSMNLTDEGTYADRNNLLRIRSPKIAADYEAEFDEMFVDDKFGGERGRPTPNPRVTIERTLLQIYFSPDDHIQAALLDLLNNSESSIYFLAYSFTADPLGEAIRKRAEAGITVSGVMDADQMTTNSGTEYDAFRTAGLDVRLDGEPGLMHHKVMIIDGKIVVMGSYNFTASAEKYNDENVIVINSPEIAAQYIEEFRRVYAAAQP